MSDAFRLVEETLDDRTQLVALHGPVGSEQVTPVLEAAFGAPDLDLVVDISFATIHPAALRALVRGLQQRGTEALLVVLSRDPELPGLVDELGAGDVVEVLPSHATARARLELARLRDPDRAPAACAPRACGASVEIEPLDGIDLAYVADPDGPVYAEGTSLSWELRVYDAMPDDGVAWLACDYPWPARLLVLVVRDGALEVGVFDAHLVTGLVRDSGPGGVAAIAWINSVP